MTHTLNILEVYTYLFLKVVHMLKSFYFGYLLHNSLVMPGHVVMRGGCRKFPKKHCYGIFGWWFIMKITAFYSYTSWYHDSCLQPRSSGKGCQQCNNSLTNQLIQMYRAMGLCCSG